MSIENSEESTEEEAETQQRKQASGKVGQTSSFINSNNTECFDCADLGCNCAEILNIAPDCGAPDCSFLDCSGADCSFLDCGSCSS